MNPVYSFSLQPYNGYAVKWSPFQDSRIAVAAAANYGLVGNGRLGLFNLTRGGVLTEISFDTQDALYDVAWSEVHENQLLVASGDGSVKLFDTSTPEYPIQSWQEHHREVYGVAWNMVTKDTFASSSWDGTVKIWSPNRSSSILTLPVHSCTYGTHFSPHEPGIVSCICSDSHLRIFDLRTPASASNHLVSLIPIHGNAPQPGEGPNNPGQPSEGLTHDWNKYRSTIIATAGVDKLVRTFDIRAARSGPVTVLNSHDYAVRRIAWSPHLSDVLLSGSYDMRVNLWSDGSADLADQSMPAVMKPAGPLGNLRGHRDFVTGVDWCLFGSEGWCVSTGWDGQMLVWDVRPLLRRN